jgi:hypothetical protein
VEGRCVEAAFDAGLVTSDSGAIVFNKIAQDLEGLRTQLNIAIRSPQGAARDIKRISLELKHLEAVQCWPFPGAGRQ